MHARQWLVRCCLSRKAAIAPTLSNMLRTGRHRGRSIESRAHTCSDQVVSFDNEPSRLLHGRTCSRCACVALRRQSRGCWRNARTVLLSSPLQMGEHHQSGRPLRAANDDPLTRQHAKHVSSAPSSTIPCRHAWRGLTARPR